MTNVSSEVLSLEENVFFFTFFVDEDLRSKRYT